MHSQLNYPAAQLEIADRHRTASRMRQQGELPAPTRHTFLRGALVRLTSWNREPSTPQAAELIATSSDALS